MKQFSMFLCKLNKTDKVTEVEFWNLVWICLENNVKYIPKEMGYVPLLAA